MQCFDRSGLPSEGYFSFFITLTGFFIIDEGASVNDPTNIDEMEPVEDVDIKAGFLTRRIVCFIPDNDDDHSENRVECFNNTIAVEPDIQVADTLNVPSTPEYPQEDCNVESYEQMADKTDRSPNHLLPPNV